MIDEMACEVVRYILFADRTKQFIRQQDIHEKIVKVYTSARGITSEVMKVAARKLEDVFGLSLYIVEGKQGKSSGKFALCRAMELSEDTRVNDILAPTEKDVSYHAFILVAISILFLNKGPMKEESFFLQLEKVGISRSQNHDVFSKIDEVVDRLVKESYLLRDRLQTDGSLETTYSVGPRAMIEISIDRVLDFIGQVMEISFQEAERLNWRNSFPEWKLPTKLLSSNDDEE
eukprot:TRINITY_DN3938_c0_g1_i2.p1 TRINITY_DN3938_c0_g1~~TRINITY_DN3938_c0_g1_i2.p1  ORF type:complete len:232 (-),score=50.70 TRINITY_DN3938_c0_g1_i2:114-809(-)